MYLNPPYDNQFGGGKREELEFLIYATNWLAIGGIMVFVAPLAQFVGNKNIAAKLDCNFKDTMLFTLPEHERKYGEAVFIGRRKTPVVFLDQTEGDNTDRLYQWNYARPLDLEQDKDMVWQIPRGDHPKNFQKIMFTPNELLTAVRGSEMNKLFETPEELVLPRPPMQLGKGHRSLLVICGFMNGVIRRGNEPPFVLRGTVDKQFYLKDAQYHEDGGSTHKYAQNTIQNVRCIDHRGKIKTFTNRRAEKAGEKAVVVPVKKRRKA
jgi:hypothetical protein